MDWLSTIIGAAIGFVSSIGIIVVQRLFEKAGRLEIYAKVVYDRPTGSHTWGFRNGRDGITLNVPIWIEIQNLSNSARILRDINLLLVSEGKDVAAMTQINRAGSKDSGEYLYANEGNYSLSVEGREKKGLSAISFSSPVRMSPILMKSNCVILMKKTGLVSFHWEKLKAIGR